MPKCALQCWHIPMECSLEMSFSTNLWLLRAEINSPCSQAWCESGWTPKPTPCSTAALQNHNWETLKYLSGANKTRLGDFSRKNWVKQNQIWFAGPLPKLLLHRAGLFRRPGRDQMLPDSSIWCHTGVRDKAKLCWDQCALRGIFTDLLSHFLMAVSSSEILSLLEPLFPRE